MNWGGGGGRGVQETGATRRTSKMKNERREKSLSQWMGALHCQFRRPMSSVPSNDFEFLMNISVNCYFQKKHCGTQQQHRVVSDICIFGFHVAFLTQNALRSTWYLREVWETGMFHEIPQNTTCNFFLGCPQHQYHWTLHCTQKNIRGRGINSHNKQTNKWQTLF